MASQQAPQSANIEEQLRIERGVLEHEVFKLPAPVKAKDVGFVARFRNLTMTADELVLAIGIFTLVLTLFGLYVKYHLK